MVTKKEKETFLVLHGWHKVPEHWVKEYSEFEVHGDGSPLWVRCRLTLDTAYKKTINGDVISLNDELDV